MAKTEILKTDRELSKLDLKNTIEFDKDRNSYAFDNKLIVSGALNRIADALEKNQDAIFKFTGNINDLIRDRNLFEQQYKLYLNKYSEKVTENRELKKQLKDLQK